jgi:hypothetical protein
MGRKRCRENGWGGATDGMAEVLRGASYGVESRERVGGKAVMGEEREGRKVREVTSEP